MGGEERNREINKEFSILNDFDMSLCKINRHIPSNSLLAYFRLRDFILSPADIILYKLNKLYGETVQIRCFISRGFINSIAFESVIA